MNTFDLEKKANYFAVFEPTEEEINIAGFAYQNAEDSIKMFDHISDSLGGRHGIINISKADTYFNILITDPYNHEIVFFEEIFIHEDFLEILKKYYSQDGEARKLTFVPLITSNVGPSPIGGPYGSNEQFSTSGIIVTLKDFLV